MDNTFEKNFARLEEIAEKLESGEVPLEEALKLFNEGSALAAYLQGEIKGAEQKLEILRKGQANA
ncbi:MAG: exodeoxyribonuclease VII small subunit [Oscillospiraceae bacterium]|jgi:exodeoxyribonuclease VII small subunit|nr:exodeoxyribonuclease VII small subunit [Oscillospiraceae bacterium]